MTNDSEASESWERLGQASRRGAIISILGFVTIMASILYAFLQLHKIENEREQLQTERAQLVRDIGEYKNELNATKKKLASSRAALSSARAAITAFHEGNLSEAVLLYDEALEADPNDAYLQNLRAYSLFRLGRVNDAVKGERVSVALAPDYAWGYFDLARFLCASSPASIDEAKAAALKAIKLRPDLRLIMQYDGEFQRVCRHQIP